MSQKGQHLGLLRASAIIVALLCVASGVVEIILSKITN
jgi:hypothetical protein